MTALYWLGGALALFVFVYLLIALFNAEDMS
jgi:K+-transporting ATPase KdpF subunit